MKEFDFKVHFSYGKRVKDDIPCHYLKIEPEEVLLDKPTVFYFGGTGTNSTMQVNGGLKMIENVLREFSPEVDLIGMHYNYIDPYDDNEAIDRNIDEFVDSILFRHIQKKGKVLDVKQVCKKMRNITIFAHCYGKKIADRMVGRLENRLCGLGYSFEDSEKIASQIFIISHASEPFSKMSYAKTLDVVSPLDDLIRGNEYAWRLLLENLDKVQSSLSDKQELLRLIKEYGVSAKNQTRRFYKNNDRVFVIKTDDDEIYLAPSMPIDQYWWEHGLKYVARDEEYKANSNATEVGDYVSRCLLCALCNSVANSILNNREDKFTPFELDYLKLQLEEVVRELNNKKTVAYDSGESYSNN